MNEIDGMRTRAYTGLSKALTDFKYMRADRRHGAGHANALRHVKREMARAARRASRTIVREAY